MLKSLKKKISYILRKNGGGVAIEYLVVSTFALLLASSILGVITSMSQKKIR